MTSASWKVAERRIARRFGAERNPLSGIRSGHGTHSDSLHPKLYIETKHFARHALFPLLDDTRTKAKREGKTALVALCRKGTPQVAIAMDLREFGLFWDVIAELAAMPSGIYMIDQLDALRQRAQLLTGHRP
jgi:hypothetical protein